MSAEPPREEDAPLAREAAPAGGRSADDEAAGLAAAREQARLDFAREEAEAAAAGEAAGREKAEARAARRGAPAASGMRRGYARGRARDEAIRAQLTPLGPDERPLGLLLAFALVLVVCGANAILAVVDEQYPEAALFVVGGAALAAGLWARLYAAVLLTQALLALAIIFAILALLFASTWLVAAAIVAVVAICSPVFWLLIRVMARLQVPRQ
jgi:hypothetical protein